MIVSSAIKRESDGKIWTGKRHSDCRVALLGEYKIQEGDKFTDGFITDKGIFLTRQEAFIEAKTCNQFWDSSLAESKMKVPVLISEDIWPPDEVDTCINRVVEQITKIEDTRILNKLIELGDKKIKAKLPIKRKLCGCLEPCFENGEESWGYFGGVMCKYLGEKKVGKNIVAICSKTEEVTDCYTNESEYTDICIERSTRWKKAHIRKPSKPLDKKKKV